MQEFYQVFTEIQQTLFSELLFWTAGESEASVPALFLRQLPLGWSHYVTLLSVTDPEARRLAREGQAVEKVSVSGVH